MTRALIFICVFTLILIVIGPARNTWAGDHSDKPCIVTEVVKEGIRSDCRPWIADRDNPGERMFMSAEVRGRLKVGDKFHFTWQADRWVAVGGWASQ